MCAGGLTLMRVVDSQRLPLCFGADDGRVVVCSRVLAVAMDKVLGFQPQHAAAGVAC